MDGLTVGRIVHYVDVDGTHVAAIVSNVTDKETGRADLMTFDTSNIAEAMGNMARPQRHIAYSEGKERDTWHWIEKA